MAWEIETVFDLDDESLFAEMVDNNIGLFMWDVITDINDPDYPQYQDNLNSYTVPAEATSLSQVQFDASVDPLPVWEEIKERFFKWVTEIHIAEVILIDINIVLPALIGHEVMFRKAGERWLDFHITSGEDRPTWAEMKTKAAELDVLKSAQEIVAAAYKTMSDNICVQIFAIFKTTDQISASAFAQSWRMKAERPAEYAEEGLIATEAIAGFTIGDALDDEAKVLAYYTEKVNQLIAFDKFRDSEIMTYLAVKAAQGL